MNIVDLRVVSEIILKYNEVFSVIEINERKRINKIAKNKFSKLSI